MGSSDSKIETSNIDPTHLQAAHSQQPSKYVPPFRRFGELYRKNNHPHLTYKLAVSQPFAEQITLQTLLYPELEEAFHAKTENIVIQGVINDEEIAERWVFQANCGEKKESLIIRPFASNQSHVYANILCEVHFSQLATSLHCPYLHKMEDNYILQTGIDSLDQPNSHVLVMERVDANLSQIIGYRRKNRWDWGQKEFNRFVSDLVEGLEVLHNAGVTHNDIRPATVYFSVKENCYLLGGYSNCLKGEGNSTTKLNSGSNFSAPQSSHQHEVDLLKGDVYSLGLTLLCAFYLCQPLDRKLYVQQNKAFAGKYDILEIIEKMLLSADQRPSIAEIRAKLPAATFKYQKMQQLVDSMHHRQPLSSTDATAVKLATGWAYQRLGLFNQWKKEYDEAFELSQSGNGLSSKADSLLQLALIDRCRGFSESSSNYAKSAAGIYRQLGEQQLDSGNLGAAEHYFKKAVSCSKYYEKDIDLARSLTGLSRVHTEKNEYKLARTLASAASGVASKSSGKDSFDWCELRISEARLESEFGNFEAAQKDLDQCQAIADKKEALNPLKAKLLRAHILAEKGNCYLKSAENQNSEEGRTRLLNQADSQLARGVDIYQGIDEDHHLELAQIITLLGKVQFKKDNYQQSVKDYNKALDLINHVQLAENKKLKEKGDILRLRGTANSFLGQTDEALKDYEQSLSVYRHIYGSDHNRASALVIGNLGRVYMNAGQEQKARECLKVCQDILGDVAGKQDADYLHFQAVEQHLHQYRPSQKPVE